MSSHSIDNAAADRLVRGILAALRGVRFGSVEITVHDGRVVQIERRERTRLELDPLQARSQAKSANRNTTEAST